MRLVWIQNTGPGNPADFHGVSPDPEVGPGDKIDLVLDMGAAHLFDKETERAIR